MRAVCSVWVCAAASVFLIHNVQFQEREAQTQRRALRLQQVREQEREFAGRLRESVQAQASAERKILEGAAQQEWGRANKAECARLRDRVESVRAVIGEGHRAAAQLNTIDVAAQRRDTVQASTERASAEPV